MVKVFKREKTERVEFCDRCASVCDSSCRRDAVRNQNVDRAINGRLGF